MVGSTAKANWKPNVSKYFGSMRLPNRKAEPRLVSSKNVFTFADRAEKPAFPSMLFVSRNTQPEIKNEEIEINSNKFPSIILQFGEFLRIF